MASSAKKNKHAAVTEDGLRGTMKDSGKTAAELDAARRRNMAYEYLCHLEEAKNWMEACLKTELPAASELEGALRNGVYVARLAMFFAPTVVKQKQIYDFDEAVYKENGLRFRHTDNIVRFSEAMRSVKFPDIFYPEVTDLYDKKNMPRVIYCIHALSRYLFQLGIAPKIQNLHGIAKFTDEELTAIDEELTAAGVQMPTFGSIDGVLAKELGADIGTVEGTMAEIAAAVEASDNARLLAALKSLATGFQHVDDDLIDSYMAALKGQSDLTPDKVQRIIDSTNAEAAEKKHLDAIKAAIAAKDTNALLAALSATPWGLSVDRANGAEYLEALSKLSTLSPDALRNTVNKVNTDAKTSAALRELNAALKNEDHDATFTALRSPALGLVDVDDAGAIQYHAFLKNAQTEKGKDLALPEVQEGVNNVNLTAEENAKLAAAIFKIHEAVRSKNAPNTLSALQNPDAHVTGVQPQCSQRYLDLLSETLSGLQGTQQPKWRECKTDDGRTYYFNKETNTSQWVAPLDEVIMTSDQIQDCVDRANTTDARWQRLVSATPTIVQLQARIRGLLARKALKERLDFLSGQNPQIVKIQAHTRGMQQRKRYQDRLKYFRDNLPAIIRIQATWKGLLARRQYKNLTKVADPPVATVRRFLHLLDQSDADLAEELAVQQLKEKVVLEIKHNVELESSLSQMDLKIGLLIKNRISLDDVVRQSRVLKRQQRNGSQHAVLRQGSTGITALTKESRLKLQSYEHLFYLLQTQPVYLARLIFIDVPLEEWASTTAQKFLQRVTETVYNYASNDREQYLLFKLFRSAMSYEVNEKISSSKDFITGNPTVVKLVMAHNRSAHADGSYLKETLGAFVKHMLEHDELDLNTNPVEVYKTWLNKQEAETGQKSALPYDVTRDVALEHAPVRAMVDAITSQVLTICQNLLNTIAGSAKSLPFGLRSICKDLYSALQKRFATESEDDLMKCVGNILYYRYMNPAVIAPDAFDVIDHHTASTITPITRNNMGHVAKILQMAAAGQTIGDGSPLDQFLRSAWATFRAFFTEAMNVPSLEEHYHIDEYSEVMLKTRPAIVITYFDMYWLHRMIVAQLAQLAPKDTDPLRVIVADLGPLADPVTELGEEDSAQFAQNKVEMSLTLVNKFEVPEQEDSSVKALFMRTKRLLVDLIRFKQGPNLPEILRTTPLAEEEEAYAQFVVRRKKEFEKAKRRADEDPDKPQPTPLQVFSSLTELQAASRTNIDQLVREGLAKPENNYQDLLNAVAQDIRNQRMYRKQRREELARLNRTLTGLRSKQAVAQETITEYETYVNDCMKHMGKARPRKQGMLKIFRSNKSDSSHNDDTWLEGRSVKYSAARLKEKGVIVSIDGVTDTQLRSVNIEITSAEKGVFEVAVSSMFTKASKEDIVLQDLLQMQYQNTPTIKLFDIVTVNVNLLLFLINKKFLGGAK